VCASPEPPVRLEQSILSAGARRSCAGVDFHHPRRDQYRDRYSSCRYYIIGVVSVLSQYMVYNCVYYCDTIGTKIHATELQVQYHIYLYTY
jgi:hypothetical protein